MERIDKKLNEYFAELRHLKEKYANESNTINYFFWPIMSANKKAKKDRVYFLGLCICAIAVAIVFVALDGLRNEYLLGIVFGICGLLLALSIFLVVNNYKERKEMRKEWDERNKVPEAIQEQIKEVSELAVNEMYKVICYINHKESFINGDSNLDKLIEETKIEVTNALDGSVAYDDVLGYYNSLKA